MAIKSEAKLTTFEAISMIVGNSIGTGIIAVPYLATKNSMIDVIWMVGAAYVINVILHLIIAELSYNNGGVQLVKSFEGELFRGVMKKVFSWIVFVVYGLAIMIGVSGNINGGAQIFVNWFGLPLWAAQIIYYVIAGIVVFMGMKAVGIAQKYAVILLMGIVAVMTVGTFTHRLEKTKEITTVPDSCVDMLFEYGENGMNAYAIGSPIKALDVEWQGKKEYFGVRFMPGRMPVGLNVTLRDLVDCRFYLEDILLDNNGTFVSGMEKKKIFKDRINYFLEEYTKLEMRQEKPFGKMEILMAVKELAYNSGGLMRISEMADTVGYTERYINKIFIEQMGFSPKVFCKIIQFQRSLEFLNYGNVDNMTEAAVNLGYYDQPQFIRDFKTYCGMTPKRYLMLTKRIRYNSLVENVS